MHLFKEMSGKLSRKRPGLSQSPAANTAKEEKKCETPVKVEVLNGSRHAKDTVDGLSIEIQQSTPMSSQQIQGYTESEITWAEAVSPLVNRWKSKSGTQNKGDTSPGEESPPMFRPSRFMELRKHPIKRMKGADDSPKRDSGSPKPLEILEKLVAAFRQEKQASTSEEEVRREPSPDRNGNDISLNNSEDFMLSQALDDVESKLRSSSPILSQRSSTPKSRMTPRRAMRLRSKISPVLRKTQSDVSNLRSGNCEGTGNVSCSVSTKIDNAVKSDLVSGKNAKLSPSTLDRYQATPVKSSVNTPSIKTDSDNINCSQPVIRCFSFKAPSASVRPSSSVPASVKVPTNSVATPPMLLNQTSKPLVPPLSTVSTAATGVASSDPKANRTSFGYSNKLTPLKQKEEPKGNWKRWSSMPDKSPVQKNDGFDDDDDFESLISGIKDDSELQLSFSQPAPARPASSAEEVSMDDDFDLELLQAVEQVEAQHRRTSLQ